MNCKSALQRMDAFMDGELPVYEHGAMKQHLAGCESCREQMQWLQVLKFELSKLPEHMPDREFEERILAKTYLVVRDEEMRKTRFWMSIAAGVAIMCALGMSYRRNQEVESQAMFAESERELQLDQDRMVSTDSDPLSGSSVILPASYGP